MGSFTIVNSSFVNTLRAIAFSFSTRAVPAVLSVASAIMSVGIICTISV
jgi:hypothetical protein